MKNAVPVLSLVLGVVLLIVALVIPSGSEDSSFIQMVKMVPEDMEEFYYFDIGVLQADEDLQSAWDSIREYYLGDDIYGENISEMTGFGLAGSESNISMWSGEFDLEQMKSVIEQSSMESFDYEGITIWTDQYAYSTAVIDGVVFIGSSEDIQLCIDISAGQGESLYDNGDVKDTVGRLPDGYILGVAAVVDDDPLVDTYGLLSIGIATSKSGGNISQSSLFKFEDSEALQEYVDLVESSITEEYDVTQDGRYLTISTTSEMPSPEEEAYSSVYNDLQMAVVAYYYDHDGVFPTINGTVNISGYDNQILDICALLVSAEGGFNEVPDGVASVYGPDNDNCDLGCAGCSAESHYIWAISNYGIFSTCIGDDCEANNEDGFQGVWP